MSLKKCISALPTTTPGDRPVTLPVAVHVPQFRHQLALFTFAHNRLYGPNRLHAIIAERNSRSEARQKALQWPIDVPHTLTPSVCDTYPELAYKPVAAPLNIQLGLNHVLNRFQQHQTLELCDCDMLHFKPAPTYPLPHDILHVCNVYEDWHLHSTTKYRYVIERYTHTKQFYNGGFVPILGTRHTFATILPDWIEIHRDILKQEHDSLIYWWAGMFALQAAVERNRVLMISKDHTYIPGFNELADQHYIAHYSVDKHMDKHRFPPKNPNWPDNAFYEVVKAYLGS